MCERRGGEEGGVGGGRGGRGGGRGGVRNRGKSKRKEEGGGGGLWKQGLRVKIVKYNIEESATASTTGEAGGL